LGGVRGYLAYNLSLRDLEEMMAERGANLDHSTVHRGVNTGSSMRQAPHPAHARLQGDGECQGQDLRRPDGPNDGKQPARFV